MAARARPVRWPRSLRASAAAEYAGYADERAFLIAVNEGTMPPPFTIGGADAWDINDLDTSIDSVKAGVVVKGTLEQRAEQYARQRRMAGRRG